MKHTAKISKVFLDTSALVAGLLSPSGAAGEIIALHKINRINIVISDYVWEEVRRSSFYHDNLFRIRLESLLLSRVSIVPYPSVNSVRKAIKIISEKDAPIIASAKAARVQALVTWDKEFLSAKVENYIKAKVYLPGDFLKKIRLI